MNNIQARQPTVTPNPVSECDAAKIKAGELRRDLSQKDSVIDQCDPDIPLARTLQRLRTENSQFVEQFRGPNNTLFARIQDKFKTGNDLAEAVKLLRQYQKEVRYHLDNAEKNSVHLENEERRYRRDFLDNEPTEGVPWHIFGFQTSDDKVMLTFWITALICFSLIAYIAVPMVQPNATVKSRIIASVLTVIVGLLSSYLLITKYG
jgi:hypothetical protein